MKLLIRLVCIGMLLLSVGLLLNSKPKFTHVGIEQLSEYYPEYSLMSVKHLDYEKYPIYFPPVTVAPGTLKYKLLPFYEDYQIMTKQYEPLFFATKRIQELVTWKDSSVKNDVLARYKALIEKQRQLIENIYDDTVRSEKREELKRYIVQHARKMKESGLSKFTGSTFTEYYRLFQIDNTIQRPEYTYSLEPIKENEDFGIYSITIDQADMPFASESTSLTVGGKEYFSKLVTKHESAKEFVYDAIPIQPMSAVEIHMPEMNQTFPVTFTPIPTKEQTENWYVADITDHIPFGTSELQITFSLAQASTTIISSLEAAGSPSALLHTDQVRKGSFTSNENDVMLVERKYLEKNTHFYGLARTKKTVNTTLEGNMLVMYKTVPKLHLVETTPLRRPEVSYQRNGDEFAVRLANVSRSQRQQFLQAISPGFMLADEKKIAAQTYQLSFMPKRTSFAFGLLCAFIGGFGLLLSYTTSRLNIYPLKIRKATRLYKASLKSIIGDVFERIVTLFDSQGKLLIALSVAYIMFEIFVLKRSVALLEIPVAVVLFIMSFGRRWSKLFVYFVAALMIAALLLFVVHKEVFRIVADWAFLFYIFLTIQIMLQKNSE